MKKEKINNLRVFSVGIPKETWVTLKKYCIDQEMSMNEVVNKCLLKLFNKVEKSQNKKLTNES